MLRTFFLLLALVSGFSTPALAADTPPDVLARSTTQEVLAILKQDKEIQTFDKKLSNRSFVEKAPPDIVEEVKEKREAATLKREKLLQNLHVFEEMDV